MVPGGNNHNIAMDSEAVEITFDADWYTVDASFTFFNSGEAATITMGFPISRGGILPAKEEIERSFADRDYKTWIEREKVEVTSAFPSLEYGMEDRNVILVDPGDIADFKRKRARGEYSNVYFIQEQNWYCKDVTFSRNDVVRTRVKYNAQYGTEGTNGLLASYIYGSGNGWKGKIRHARFTLRVSSGISIIGLPLIPHEHAIWRDAENAYVIDMYDLEPCEQDTLTVFLSKTNPPYINECGIFEDTTLISNATLCLCNGQQLKALQQRAKDAAEGWDRPQSEDAKIVNENVKRVEEYIKYTADCNFSHMIIPEPE